MSRAASLRDGIILNNRYRIIKQLNRGRLGQTYLAEDRQSYREFCVLKEFSYLAETPGQPNSVNQFQYENDLELGLNKMRRLQHPLIPRFESLLKTSIAGRRRYFVVRRYVPGISYEELLRLRGIFSESEIRGWLQEILPILGYLHGLGLVHGGIAPRNVIYHDANHQPYLIGLENLIVSPNCPLAKLSDISTALSGYAPREQLSQGQISASGDLYALAVTCLSLLTGKHPQLLYDLQLKRWDWQQINVSYNFKEILRKMLAERPGDRLQTAEEVLSLLAVNHNPRWQSLFERKAITNASSNNLQKVSARASANSALEVNQLSRNNRSVWKIASWQWGVLSAGLILVPGLISFALINRRITAYHNLKDESIDISQGQEELLQQKIYRLAGRLELNLSDFYSQVDYLFHRKHPELAGKQLTQKLEHYRYRQAWYRIATELLGQRAK